MAATSAREAGGLVLSSHSLASRACACVLVRESLIHMRPVFPVSAFKTRDARARSGNSWPPPQGLARVLVRESLIHMRPVFPGGRYFPFPRSKQETRAREAGIPGRRPRDTHGHDAPLQASGNHSLNRKL